MNKSETKLTSINWWTIANTVANVVGTLALIALNIWKR